MNHIGERMPIQNSMKIRRELHSASDLSQTSEEDFGVKHLRRGRQVLRVARIANDCVRRDPAQQKRRRSEEHTSELQSQFHLVCRLLLEKKKKNYSSNTTSQKTKKE